MNLFFPLLGAGIALISLAAFWASIQNWLAERVYAWRSELGATTHVLQSALVVLDRAVVSTQRLVQATMRVRFRDPAVQREITQEASKVIPYEQLPNDIRLKLAQQAPVQYELSVSALQVNHEPTYRLAVRRAE